MFVNRREILDFWHALERAWTFARLRYGEDSAQADHWVRQIAWTCGPARCKRDCGFETPAPEKRGTAPESLIPNRPFREDAGQMRCDEYLRLGYGIAAVLWRAPINRPSMRVCGKPECAGAR